MTLEELAAMVRLMRAHQKDYFKTRRIESLHKAQEMEKRVDKALEALAAGPDLFDKKPEET